MVISQEHGPFFGTLNKRGAFEEGSHKDPNLENPPYPSSAN